MDEFHAYYHLRYEEMALKYPVEYTAGGNALNIKLIVFRKIALSCAITNNLTNGKKKKENKIKRIGNAHCVMTMSTIFLLAAGTHDSIRVAQVCNYHLIGVSRIWRFYAQNNLQFASASCSGCYKYLVLQVSWVP